VVYKEVTLAVTLTAGGSVTVTLVVPSQPLTSDTVTVKTPAGKPLEVVEDESPLVHTKPQAPVPPTATAEVSPSECPLQLISAPLANDDDTAAVTTRKSGSVTIVLEEIEQPLASSTVTVYAPAGLLNT
jgi:hypothetical protein